MTPPILKSLGDLIEAHSSFLLVTHVEPDGDGIGSCLALAHALRRRGKSARVWLPQGLPEKYAFLPGAESVVRESGPEPVAFVLDCDNARRLGDAAEVVGRAEVVVNIDHHARAEPFGDLQWHDASAPAVGCQIYALLETLAEPLTREIAVCLYCALGTDSGFFRYANTTPDLLRMAGGLVAAGADPKAVAEATLDRYELPLVRLAGRALASLTVGLDGTAAVAILTEEDFRAAGTAQTEGVIDFLRSVAGVDLLVLLREAPEGWRVSLRSLGPVDVSAAARQLGGGGHAAASGCLLPGTAEAAWARVEAALLGARRAVDRGAP